LLTTTDFKQLLPPAAEHETTKNSVCFLLDNSWRLKFICQHFGTLCLFHPHRQRTDRQCSQALAYKLQMSGNYPEESIQDSEHGESLKSRKLKIPP